MEHINRKLLIAIIVILLLCCCVVIVTSILLGLGALGTSTVQRSARDTERLSTIQEIDLEIQAFYFQNARYPTNAEVVWYIDAFQIESDEGVQNVPLTGISEISNNAASDSDGSAYCYVNLETSYQLGVNLENGGWGLAGAPQQAGDAGLPCTGITY